ncbi:MAG: Abi family protein [Negativicutes bacterium]|nr:Abi family protein [Negativicutes bacterium]
MSKKKLSIDEQIDHMKNEKGILFSIVNENDARSFLLNNNYYFRIKAYAKNYDKYNTGVNKGKYVNLEFAYLQELSIVDMYLRKLILKLTIDIEHFLKTQMLKDFVGEAGEDGYAIVNDFLNKYSYFTSSLAYKKNWFLSRSNYQILR